MLMYQYRLSFGEAIRTCLSKYCCFSGRASRAEYWWFYLFGVIISWIAAIPYYIALFATCADDVILYQIPMYIVGLAFLLPNLGVTVRRLHDTGRGGGWIFISLIPLIGAIWLIVLLCQESQPGDNRFGPEPYMRPIGQ